ncbi:MAG: cytochrome C peroxidase, partial [Bacteroidetes bacterium]
KNTPTDPVSTDDLSDIPYNPTPFNLVVYDSFPAINIPPDNPLTEEGIQLGRRLFYDTRLSSDNSMSCASCHLPEFSFADGKAVSKGVTMEEGTRSAMSILDAAFNENGFFWDGRAATLEEQALQPVENPIELHESWENVIQKLKADPDYPGLFRRAFGIAKTGEITKELAAKAIAQFERTIISTGNTKFDRVMRGEEEFTDAELNGLLMWIDYPFDQLPDAECGHCHSLPMMTTNEYLNNGLTEAPTLNDFPDLGRGAVTGLLSDNGKFRVPSLRNIELTAPYMHDGRFKTLEEVLDHYNSGGKFSPNKSELIHALGLTDEQKQDIIAFMKTFTDRDLIENPAFQNPF